MTFSRSEHQHTNMSEQAYPSELALVYYPAPVLRRVADPVTIFDDELAAFCQAMIDCMEASKGVGLAAPQVGVSKRIFTTNHTGSGEGVIPDRRIWINPEITFDAPNTLNPPKASDESSEAINASEATAEHSYEEGCLSIPGCYSQVTRPARIHISWQDLTGAHHQATFDANQDEFLSTICQHELDHLDGKLFLDYLSRPSLQLLRRKLKTMEKDYKRAFNQVGKPLRF